MRYDILPLVIFTVFSVLAIILALGTFTMVLVGIDISLWIYFAVTIKIVKSLELSSTVSPSRVFTDDDVKCTLKLSNGSKYLLSKVGIQDLSSDGYITNGSKEASGMLNSNGTMELSYIMRFRARGEHEFYGIKIHVESALKLFSIDRAIEPERKILVFPKILPIDSLKTTLIDPVSGKKTDFKILEDSSHIVGIHEYSGEPFQRIHWKASAHTGELMVKEYEYTGSSQIRMYVDYNLPKEIFARNVWSHMRKDYEEYASISSSGIVKYLYDNGMPITLKVLAQKSYTVTPQMVRDYIPYLDVLAIAKGTDEPSNDLLLQTNIIGDMFSMSRTTTVIIVSMYLTDEIIPKLLTLRSRISKLLVFVIPYGFRMPYDKKYDTYAVLPSEVKKLRDQSSILVENNVMVHVMMDNESFDEVIKRYDKTMERL